MSYYISIEAKLGFLFSAHATDTLAEETIFERGGKPSHSTKRDQCFLYRVEETEAQRRR